MTRDEIRLQIWDFFKKCSSDDFHSVVSHKYIANIQKVRDLFRRVPLSDMMNEGDVNPIILEIINEWVNNGLLAFGNKNDLDNTVFGWLTVTEYGRECFQNGTILPYDPDKYLTEYKILVPQVDNITLEYLAEAITSYNRDLLLSSTVTLGVASENSIILLIEAFINAMNNGRRKTNFMNSINRSRIARQFSSFKSELLYFNSQIPPNLKQDLDTYLDGIFNFIRLNRNQAGHPTGSKPTKKVALHNIQMFVDYSRRVFNLRDFFINNRLT
jgi:hypothetical protein